MGSTYPQMKEINAATVGAWQECLGDLDFNLTLVAIKKHIMESRFPPTVAEIREQVAEIRFADEGILDAATAWGEVMKALRNYGLYNYIEGEKDLSSVTLKTVQAIGWRELHTCENLSIIRGQFMKMYESMAKREKADRLLPEGFKRDIKKLAETKRLIERGEK